MGLDELRPPSGIPQAAPYPSTAQQGLDSDQSKARAQDYLREVKTAFDRQVKVAALRVPAKDIGHLRAASATDDILALQRWILRLPRIPSVVPDDFPAANAATRLLLLHARDVTEVAPEIAAFAFARGYEFVQHSIKLDYRWYSADAVLSALLPGVDTSATSDGTPSSYTVVGHIAQLNLKEAYLPYRFVIGQVILDKNRPTLRTIVNKLDTIHSEFRYFDMELLAGDDDYMVTSSTSGCSFTFDFRKVYFNSRLHTEHARVVASLGEGQVVADVMAGVGPFAIPAAKGKRCRVYANDLNPACYESLRSNAKRNQVEPGVFTQCQDGRRFIRKVVLKAWQRTIGQEWQGVLASKTQQARDRRRQQGKASRSVTHSVTKEASNSATDLPSKLVDHFLMNLPATALDFLDAYRGLYAHLAEHVGLHELEQEMQSKAQDLGESADLPTVHVYTFTKQVERAADDIVGRANAVLGLAEDSKERLIAPEAQDITTAAPLTASTNPATGQDAHALGSSQLSGTKCRLHFVRSVAPNKDMYCLSFKVPKTVLFDSTV